MGIGDQLHAGTNPHPRSDDQIKKVWHTGSDGSWWTGFVPSSPHGLTTQELLDLARSIEADLLRLFPDLK